MMKCTKEFLSRLMVHRWRGDRIARESDCQVDSEIIPLCYPAPAPEFSTPSLQPLKAVFRDERRETTRYLKSLCSKVEREGVRATYLIREGSVAETILEVAEFMQTEMIAMSTHGRSGAQFLLLGSVTYQVVRRSAGAVQSSAQNRRVSFPNGWG
jgi:nucleotide-binding universal stress UspA family protein